MPNNILSAGPAVRSAKKDQAEPHAEGENRAPAQPPAWRGVAGLLVLGSALAVAACTLGARTWQVGTSLGAALFPVESIIELAAVAVGTAVAGWVGLHSLIALTCVLAGRNGRRWAAAERTVARHAPAVVRRLARVAAGASLGLALTAPTAMAAPDWHPGPVSSGDTDSAVVLELGWQPTESWARSPGTSGAPDRSAVARPRPAPERSSLVNRGRHTGAGREPLVVVEPGDTLWAIAADRLAPERTTARPPDGEVAAAVRQWHHANREALGTDPDLIRPGMVLREP